MCSMSCNQDGRHAIYCRIPNMVSVYQTPPRTKSRNLLITEPEMGWEISKRIFALFHLGVAGMGARENGKLPVGGTTRHQRANENRRGGTDPLGL